MDFDVAGAGTMQEALGLLPAGRFSVVLLDLNLPDNFGLEGIDKILATPEAPPVIVLTGMDNQETGLQALARNAQDYLVKGRFDSDMLVRSIRYAIQRDQSERAMRQMNAELESQVAEQTAELRTANLMLEQHVAARTAELEVANESLRASRLAALNIMEDALSARSEAENERNRLAALVNNITDEVWFADTTKRFTLVNSAALREFGIDLNNALEVEKFAASLEVFRPDGSPRPVDEAPPLRALRGETVKNLEEIIKDPNQRANTLSRGQCRSSKRSGW